MALAVTDCFYLKLWHIVGTAGQSVLSYVLMCGTDDKLKNVLLEDYLRTLPNTSTSNATQIALKSVEGKAAEAVNMQDEYNKIIKKEFNKTDRNSLIKFCHEFDITLLVKVIKLVCENVAKLSDVKWTDANTDLEYYVTAIKHLRNHFAHGKSSIDLDESVYLKEIEKCKELLRNTIQAAGERYKRMQNEVNTKIVEVMRGIDLITDETLSKTEILQRSSELLLPEFQRKAEEELRKSLENSKQISPLAFLSGQEETQVQVKSIFTRIEVEEEGYDSKASHPSRSSGSSLDYRTLLAAAHELGTEQPHLIMVEGDAGMGKTTLLSFMVAEWLSDLSDETQTMHGLRDFKIVLKIVCREETSESLESFLETILPDTCLFYRKLLLPLLKKTKTLIIVDGLDEHTEASRKLIKDIVNQTKLCPNFTLITSSRPEGIKGMKAITPAQFKISHVKIVGIDDKDRMSFAQKYMRVLTKDKTAKTDMSEKNLEQIIHKEIFRIPLNILFFIYICTEEEFNMRETVTGTWLHETIMDMLIEKLKNRIEKAGNEFLCDSEIEEIMEIIHKVSFEEIRDGNVFLTDRSKRSINEACRKYDINKTEVFSAFFSLRQERVGIKTVQKYCMPHKGMQEFLAARYMESRITTYKQGDIRRLLEESLTTRGKTDTLMEKISQQFHNTFAHLLGLMTSQQEPIREIVDLLHESGVNTTDEWMDLLSDTRISDSTLDRVAYHITNNDEDNEADIRDWHMDLAKALLPRIPQKKLKLDLDKNLSQEDQEVVAKAVSGHTVTELLMHHHYQHPHQGASAAYLLQNIERSDLTRFLGQLDAEILPLLPDSVWRLCLSVADDHHINTLLPALRETVKAGLTTLLGLGLHVPVPTFTSPSFCSLPVPSDDGLVCLLLSGVSDDNLEKACDIAESLCPLEKGFWKIAFPGCTLNMAGYKRLLEGLEKRRHRGRLSKYGFGDMYVPETTITMEEERELNAMLREGSGLIRRPEEGVWYL